MANYNRGSQSKASRYKLKDKKITIYRRESSTNSNGFPAYGYKPIHPGKLWAYFRQIGGSQYYAAKQMQIEEEAMFCVNWREDLTLDAAVVLFIEYNGTWYSIQRVDTFEGYKSDICLYSNSLKYEVDPEEVLLYTTG